MDELRTHRNELTPTQSRAMAVDALEDAREAIGELIEDLQEQETNAPQGAERRLR